ncbi:RNA-binding 26 [Brachionus plicatilis]|uniref:RNA-binding 26 n=1 Tax=Brachionus plicatilis TaxID=10195 RepID=A0A3M7SJF3_BRAPC|nr:RNA-binding 26 [Brachionus plicatilis]
MTTYYLYPETVKSNQLIVKTANFVAKQGLQAEILLKTKQSGNSQFNFLLHGDQLHPYYKHVIALIQDNKIDPVFYLQQEAENKPNPEPMLESETESDEDNYLHPLLSNVLNRTPSVNSMTKDQQPLENVQDENPNPSETIGAEKDQEVMEEPSGNQKIMIDKLVEYVFRNGPEFEENLRKKNDSRFDFLNSDHKFYRYYKFKIETMLKKKNEEDEIKNNKRSHKSHRKDRKKSEDATSESDDSDLSASDNSENGRENEKKHEKKRPKERKKHKRHKSRHEKSSSRKRHESSRKKNKKRIEFIYE